MVIRNAHEQVRPLLKEMRGVRQKARCQKFSVRSCGWSPGCAAILHLLGWSVSCLMPLLFPPSIWVDWTRVSHRGVSGLVVLLHFWAFCQGMELFWSLSGKMITARSPTHALDPLLFPWYDIVAISENHCFLRKIAIQFLKKKKKKSCLCWKLEFGWRLHLSLCM